ncbi:MAG: flavodoxin domain-containing protein [Pseudomonadota bacterium]
MKLKILVATMTRTAEHVARAIEMDCTDLVCIEVKMMDDLDISVFDGAEPTADLFLICSSTYGSGDLPDNAHRLYESLDSDPRFLGHVRYGVVALGDRTYGPTFCFGGKRFDERLQGLGAVRTGEIWCHDASAGTVPELEASAWCRAWLSTALSESS